MLLFRLFERLLEPTAPPGKRRRRRALRRSIGIMRARPALARGALFVAGFVVALLDTSIPVFIGRVVTLVSSHAPGRSAARTLAASCSAWRRCC